MKKEQPASLVVTSRMQESANKSVRIQAASAAFFISAENIRTYSVKKIQYILCLLVCISVYPAQATTLSDLKPHAPTDKPWNEQWFYYFNDPLVGYFKITFQTFIYKNDPSLKERGYLHLVYTPLNGEIRSYEYMYDDVVLIDKTDTEYGFQFHIPGVADVHEEHMSLTTPDFTFDAQLTNEHSHYWKLNKGASPYSLLTALPMVDNRWFVFSMATPAEYRFTSDTAHHEGTATTYIDKGWSVSQAANYAFIMATEENAQLMIAGGSDEGLPIEMWAGKFSTPDNSMTFLPSLTGLSVKRVMKPCEGELDITFTGLGRKLVVHSKADPDDFEDATVPSTQIFGAEHPSAKTMNARTEVELYRFGQLRERKVFTQGALEFGGGMHCNAQ